MLLGHFVEMFPVHLRFPRGGAHVAGVAREQPPHVSLLEFGVVLRPRLAVTPLRLEVSGSLRPCAGDGKWDDIEDGLPSCARHLDAAVEDVSELANVARPVV